LLSILSASGNKTAALTASALGSGNSTLAGAAIDAAGNFWIIGETDSDDFPLVHALYTQKPDYKQTGFIAKLDPSLNILFSTFLGGQPALGLSTPVAVALDSSGNAYVAGSTDDLNFPATGTVFGVGLPSSSPIDVVTYTFAVKISSNGSSVLSAVCWEET
jgi:large repetitive protein